MDVFQVNRVAKTKPLKGQCSKTHNDTIVKDNKKELSAKRKHDKPNAIFMNFKSKSNKKKSNK
tara:strand:- start:212 stop:400 length:189 start_codon:yes stop_codon:yes gene_type:complete